MSRFSLPGPPDFQSRLFCGLRAGPEPSSSSLQRLDLTIETNLWPPGRPRSTSLSLQHLDLSIETICGLRTDPEPTSSTESLRVSIFQSRLIVVYGQTQHSDRATSRSFNRDYTVASGQAQYFNNFLDFNLEVKIETYFGPWVGPITTSSLFNFSEFLLDIFEELNVCRGEQRQDKRLVILTY